MSKSQGSRSMKTKLIHIYWSSDKMWYQNWQRSCKSRCNYFIELMKWIHLLTYSWILRCAQKGWLSFGCLCSSWIRKFSWLWMTIHSYRRQNWKILRHAKHMQKCKVNWSTCAWILRCGNKGCWIGIFIWLWITIHRGQNWKMSVQVQ